MYTIQYSLIILNFFNKASSVKKVKKVKDNIILLCAIAGVKRWTVIRTEILQSEV